MIFDNLPERTHSKFIQSPPNEDIFLREVTVIAELGDKKFSGFGGVFLTWHPSPRLVVRTNIEPDAVVAMTFFIENERSQIIVDGIDGDWNIIHPSPITATTFQNNPSQVKGLVKAQFHLINFASYISYIGTLTRTSSGGASTSRLILSGTKWHIILDSVESTPKKVKKLKKEGGYAITHVGTLSPIDGSTFSSEILQDFLKSFTRFMAFVQGQWAPPAIILGFNNDDEPVWVKWGVQGNSSSWRYVTSWFDPVEAVEILPPVFKGYSQLIEQPEWKDVFSKVIYWYVLANTSNFDATIILAQASLELLSWQILVKDQQQLSKNAYKKKNARELISLLLSSCGIPLDVPNGLSELVRYSQGKKDDQGNVMKGPGSVTRIRNYLVHPEKKETIDGLVILQASQLALSYIELILLSSFGYKGRYASRVLGRTRMSGELQLVPWVANKP